MPEVVAKVAQQYPVGTWRQPGDRFHVEPEHVRLLAAIGRIETPEGEEKKPAPQKSLQAAPAGNYRTRDMAAQETKAPRKTRNRASLLGGRAT